MTNIQVIKIGNMVNLSINGKLHKKNCGSPQEADELFKIALKAKENSTDEENVKTLKMYLNEKLRKAIMAGIEADVETGETYLAGFNTPIPETLLEVIKEYNDNGYPIDAIINFWKLLMINPDKRVRVSLFDFIKKHDFVLTDKGYMVVYKAVYYKDNQKPNANLGFVEFVSNQYLHVKKTWKCNPNKYVTYKDNKGENIYGITKLETAETWDENDKGIEFLGNLGDLYNAFVLKGFVPNDKEANTKESVLYTDMYSRTMTIQLGVPTQIERKDCDSNPAIDCSYGLHCGATKYVQNYADRDSIILACFVNPANVVAVPNYDHSKMRTTEYFPFAVATYENGKIDIVEQKYFEDDYSNYEQTELEALVAKVKAEELPISTAKNAEEETRPMSELMKILEQRIYDLK